MATKLDESRFPGIQLHAKVRAPFTQLDQEPLGLDSMLEPGDNVTRKAHDNHIAKRLLLAPSPDPQVEQDCRDES
ncbi:MAG: hypothetical protein ACYDDO_03735 [Acidiferrobacterales bacterium]